MNRRSSFAALLTGTLTVALASFSLGGPIAATASPVAAGPAHSSGAGSTVVHNDIETSTTGPAMPTRQHLAASSLMWSAPGRSRRRRAAPAGGFPYSSFWVGIDGYSSSSVEQLGTDSDCAGNTPDYYAWWEMYPAGTQIYPRLSTP